VVRPEDVPPESALAPLTRPNTAYDLLRRSGATHRSVVELPRVGAGERALELDPELAERCVRSLEVEARYDGYVAKQTTEIERQRRQEHTRLPAQLDYTAVRGLSTEVREKLARIRPESIGQAGRISGVTPAAISLLLVHLKKTLDATRESRAAS